MTRAGILLVLSSFSCEWLRFLKSVLDDAEVLLVFPVGLASLVTVALFGVEWMIQGFDGNE